MTVATLSIVEDLDVVEDIDTGQVTGFVDAFADAFLFQTAEEGLGHSVAPTISSSAHAGRQSVGTAEPHPVICSSKTGDLSTL